MAKYGSLLICYISFILIVTMSLQCGAIDEDRQVYIVYMGSLPQGDYSPSSHHLSILQEVVDESFVNDSLVVSYKRSFNGFAANLTHQEQQKIASMEGVVSVFPSKTLQLQTTRSWDFMGFSETVQRNPTVESDVVIGIFDGGIWPESESFSDKGFGPPPKKWAGACKGGQNFTCNNKIIGARYYTGDNAFDNTDGHGTHAASIAAGNKVNSVDFYGLAQGNARGGVPSARIASYKACHYPFGCPEQYIFSAFDDAIADGVDIISISTVYGSAMNFAHDCIAIGAFHAMKKGILTLNSAGNFGPNQTSISSVTPWVLTVGASSIDRRFINKAVLGDGTTLVGDSINTLELKGNKVPLVYGHINAKHCPEFTSRRCVLWCLDEKLVKGKIVVCDEEGGQVEAYRAGALGALSPSSIGFIWDPLPFPAFGYSIHDGEKVMSYVKSMKNPEANILKSNATKDDDAPKVSSFSSRGPNVMVPDIIKPDITAPGVEILAAFPPIVRPSLLPGDFRKVKYSIMSGTSIACPHATGAAAYVKSFHPNWSPSSIKSALMTTAWVMNSTKNPDAEFAYGSGHIDPVKAADPGLVYDALAQDYIKLLCSMGYDTGKVRLITGDNSSCPKDSKGTPKDLNYPSMAAQVTENKPFKIEFPRTVTNVGLENSTYKAKVTLDSRIKIDVVPSVLSFKSLNEEKSFVASVVGTGLPENSTVSASLVWSDGTHSVRSPIVVYTNKGHKG